jgi:hypothetical protein
VVSEPPVVELGHVARVLVHRGEGQAVEDQTATTTDATTAEQVQAQRREKGEKEGRGEGRGGEGGRTICT